MPANSDKAASAHLALQAFSINASEAPKGILYDEVEAVLADLLTALRHMCEYERIDFDTAVEQSKTHFTADIDQ